MEGPGWAQAVGWPEEECPAGPCTIYLQGMMDSRTARLWLVPGAQILDMWLGGLTEHCLCC